MRHLPSAGQPSAATAEGMVAATKPTKRQRMCEILSHAQQWSRYSLVHFFQEAVPLQRVVLSCDVRTAGTPSRPFLISERDSHNLANLCLVLHSIQSSLKIS